MRWPRRRRTALGMPNETLAGLLRNIQVHHDMTVRHEPIPKPEAAEVVFKRPDGSQSYRYQVHVGRQALTVLNVPLSSIYDGPITPATFLTMEFVWHR